MNPEVGAFIGAAIAGLACTLLIGTVIGAIILRAAIALFNLIVGGPSPNGVADPNFGKAMLITFVTWLVQIVLQFVIGLATAGATVAAAGAGGQRGVAAAQGINLIAIAVSYPVMFLVMAGMLTAMLPTSFGRALLVTLLAFVIGVVIFGVIAVGLAVVGFGMLSLGR